MAAQMIRALAVLLLVLAACGPSAPPAPKQPAFTVDDRQFPATVALAGTRQSLTVDVTGISGARIFDADLTELHATIDLSAVPDDQPGVYDIHLVAACSSTITLNATVGGVTFEELTASTQKPWNQLSIDGCPFGRATDVYELKGQTNISKLDASKITLFFFASVSRNGEKRSLALSWTDVAFK